MNILRLRCWWYGHKEHPQDWSAPGQETCMHCGESVPYHDLVGDTRHNRALRWLVCWLEKLRPPRKCPLCGVRSGHRDDCDYDIPF